MSNSVYAVEVEGKKYRVEVIESGNGTYLVKINDKNIVVRVSETEVTQEPELNVVEAPSVNEVTQETQSAETGLEQVLEIRGPEVPSGATIISSEIPGRILKILVSEGSKVSIGDTVVTIESMKMELEIKSPRNGVVEKIYVRAGDTINVGDKIALIR
ncbi:MAG: biotin/lipoyl-containing protein [Desulfurococcaceae archaeon TW002]